MLPKFDIGDIVRVVSNRGTYGNWCLSSTVYQKYQVRFKKNEYVALEHLYKVVGKNIDASFRQTLIIEDQDTQSIHLVEGSYLYIEPTSPISSEGFVTLINSGGTCTTWSAFFSEYDLLEYEPYFIKNTMPSDGKVYQLIKRVYLSGRVLIQDIHSKQVYIIVDSSDFIVPYTITPNDFYESILERRNNHV